MGYDPHIARGMLLESGEQKRILREPGPDFLRPGSRRQF